MPMKVFYRPEQCAETDSFSPSAAKPRWVVQDWLDTPELDIEVEGFEPATVDELCRAHERSFVEGVLAGRRRNGFSNRDASVAASLPYTSGSLMAAARWAIANKQAACSPTSGFHHAGWDAPAGFCTFNGLMACVLAMRAEGLAGRIGILDCDAHYGNGTDEIIAKLGVEGVVHRTMGRRFQVRSDAAGGAFEHWLEHSIDMMLDCDLVLYQAGADPHVLDPHGGILESAEMAERDLRVFERLRGVPMAWCLAGGYQTIEGEPFPKRIEPVLALHRQTALAWNAVHGR